MASLDILCFNPFNLKNKIMKIEHKKIFCGPSKILKNISWPINICLKYLMTSTKTLCLHPPPPLPPCYILNVWPHRENHFSFFHLVIIKEMVKYFPLRGNEIK